MNTLSFLSFSVSVKALCKECVVERCRVLRLKNQLNEDYKTVNNLLKATVKRYVTWYMLFHKLKSQVAYHLWIIETWDLWKKGGDE